MTDKQIIIDGVDVSKCEYRDWRNFCCCNNSKENEGEERVTGRGGCKYNPNCYYKQLKRKEQECKNLEEELRGCRIGIKDISIENTEICKISEKYKQALDKIEDIADDYNRVEKTSQYYRDGFDEIEKYLDAQQKYFDGEDYHNLLDIINEAKEGNNDR